jgi:hypothetical protein
MPLQDSAIKRSTPERSKLEDVFESGAFGDAKPSMEAIATAKTNFAMKVTAASLAKLTRDPSRRLRVYKLNVEMAPSFV